MFNTRSKDEDKWAELDLYLRHSRLGTPVLEGLLQRSIPAHDRAEGVRKSQIPHPETPPDLVAGPLTRPDIDEAIRLLASEKDRGVFSLDDTFLLTSLYCLNGSAEKAEALAAANAGSIKKRLVR